MPPRKSSPAPEPDEDDFEALPARVTKSVKVRKGRSQGSGDGETDPVYKWGFGTIIFSMLGLIHSPWPGSSSRSWLPLPPEAQAVVLFLALLIGTGLLAGGKPANTFQRVAKYLWLTFMAFVVVIVALVVLGVMSGQNSSLPPSRPTGHPPATGPGPAPAQHRHAAGPEYQHAGPRIMSMPRVRRPTW